MIDMIELIATVQAYFDANALGTKITLGWSEQGKQTTQGTGGANRVVFVPLDGTFEGTQHPGGNPQSLFDDIANFEVRVWAIDRSTPERRESQAYQAQATKELLQWTIRAISGQNRPSAVTQLGYIPTYSGAEQWGKYAWQPDASENAFGRELRIPLTLRMPVSDVAYDTFTATPSLTKNLRAL